MHDIAHWQPIYELSVDGVLLNPIIQGRLISLSLTDKRGLEADELEIVLSDHDGKLEFPARGALIRFKGGWAHKGLIDKGTFKVQNIRHSGSPDVLTIRARAADFGGELTIKKERSFHKTTVGDILKKIAGEHKLTLKITDKLAQAKIDHIDQSNESDLNFITQLAEVSTHSRAMRLVVRILFAIKRRDVSTHSRAMRLVREDVLIVLPREFQLTAARCGWPIA